MLSRQRIRVNGTVQGVGFRPFVYRLAKELQLSGFVRNDNEGVLIEVEGRPANLEQFVTRLGSEAPTLSDVVESDIQQVPARHQREFTIVASGDGHRGETMVPPDVAVCDDCLRELFDPQNRRYRYPFTNCTNCGPRYTIVEGIPYDRPLTSMKVFPMCPQCQSEYDDPLDRRFHAQPNACPVCGPSLVLRTFRERIDTTDPIATATELLGQGKIVALRGLGGFHLAADATNEAAVTELRRRKGRVDKPFALMAPDIESVRSFSRPAPKEETLLRHYARPIVLIRAKEGSGIAPSVAPRNAYFGVMLPYTPLHHLLLRDHFRALVMTSGNLSEEPIAIGNDEALTRLSDLADYFLLHDREILQRCDDSIVRLAAGSQRVIRRARGFVPRPVRLVQEVVHPVLACGAELKNCVALCSKDWAILSQHVGDLDNPAALDFFESCIDHLQRITRTEAQVIAHDLHPEYLSTKWALAQPGLRQVGVQHHHAHLVSVMVENGEAEPAIGIILDGTGYGTDGTIWGGEVLIGDAHSFERFAWLEPVPLPGGTAAIREPWRMAVSYLHHAYGDSFTGLDLPVLKEIPPASIEVVHRMTKKRINSPLTSSCGRLFDGIAALLGVRTEINFEAQAACDLEMIAGKSAVSSKSIMIEAPEGCEGKSSAMPVAPIIRHVVEGALRGTDSGELALGFHYALAELFLNPAVRARSQHGIDRVALSGGVFQNLLFFERLHERLQNEGFHVLTHRMLPTNDGGLALGQAVIADATIRRE